MDTTAAAARFLGTTDEVDACDCCGRTGLKSTVALVLDGEDREVYFGVVCAARALSMPAKDVRKAAKRADDERWAAECAAREAAREAEYQAFQDFLDARVPALRGDRFRQLQALGGMQAARALRSAA